MPVPALAKLQRTQIILKELKATLNFSPPQFDPHWGWEEAGTFAVCTLSRANKRSQWAEWKQDTNSRGYPFYYLERKHVRLSRIQEDFPGKRYLCETDFLNYPECVFKVSNVCHVTEKRGLEGIINDQGFRGKDNFLWFNLAVTGADIAIAEYNFLNFLGFSQQSLDQRPFLKKFTTSPAFRKESRYGNFRFTFSLRELLRLYSKNFCDRTAPVLRVLDTKLYKQEIVYSVLVHPRYMTQYEEYPRLPVSVKKLCGYREGKMSWHCQSPSNNYTHFLEVDKKKGIVYTSRMTENEYFVWDNVCVAFHMEQDWVLPVGHNRLFKHLSVCEAVPTGLLKEPKMSVPEAEQVVEDLKKWILG